MVRRLHLCTRSQSICDRLGDGSFDHTILTQATTALAALMAKKVSAVRTFVLGLAFGGQLEPLGHTFMCFLLWHFSVPFPPRPAWGSFVEAGHHSRLSPGFPRRSACKYREKTGKSGTDLNVSGSVRNPPRCTCNSSIPAARMDHEREICRYLCRFLLPARVLRRH